MNRLNAESTSCSFYNSVNSDPYIFMELRTATWRRSFVQEFIEFENYQNSVHSIILRILICMYSVHSKILKILI